MEQRREEPPVEPLGEPQEVAEAEERQVDRSGAAAAASPSAD